MSVCMIILPLTASLQKSTFYPKKSAYAFLDAWSKVLGIWSVVIFCWWWCWVVILQRWWSSGNFASDIGCGDQKNCAAAFLLWFNPCILSFVCGSACVLINFLSWALRPRYAKHEGGSGMKFFTLTIGSIAAGMWLVACIAAGGRCPLLSVGVFALAALIQVPCLCRYGAELHSLHVHLHVCAGAGVRYVVCCACPCWRTERHSHSFVSAGHCTREVASGYA